ncbi:hypothetical protein CJ030_MR2G011704 [Morella rubra]|uniref:Uncharacterized protein n=1 Tax=Morella rubra TaxID=262757 RepID=A0A6A1WFM3_9ROSI|nr:hypothetical protein CJ030_MR2G011724 [Morella rubra]KAB1223683.1 hypothetical protein CJ030_MR2G011704 [Morella rubra]
MEKYFGNAYRGDPGVPHSDPDRFVDIWIGSAAFSALTFFNPYMWQLSSQFKIRVSSCILGYDTVLGTVFSFCLGRESEITQEEDLVVSMQAIDGPAWLSSWHDKAMLFEQYHWKKAMEKKQPYKFMWNQMPREVRDSYYYNWPVYFP